MNNEDTDYQKFVNPSTTQHFVFHIEISADSPVPKQILNAYFVSDIVKKKENLM